MATLRETLNYEPVELSFGTSGLRGLVTDMPDLECYINARGFLRFLASHEGLSAGGTVYLAGDLRDSTPRIMAAMVQAIHDEGLEVVNCGFIPTPTLAFYALQQQAPCIMVTGSHIPADRNGIKFYKRVGEVLKADEQAIKDAVADVRAAVYAGDAAASMFDTNGMLKAAPELPEVQERALEVYGQRYEAVFGNVLEGLKIVFYQHSAVGRDALVAILEKLGATVVPEGRSEVFVPIDSENVTSGDQAYFRELADKHPDAFAIISTDGDSDRPFLIDEQGAFHRGDVLGAVVAEWLQADFTAYPVSSSDAVDGYLNQKGVPFQHTRIGSPYVIAAMQDAQTTGSKRTVGWEVNGGFLIGNDLEVRGRNLHALPTRDALLPIIIALVSAQESGQSVSGLFATLPPRFTQAGLIDNFPVEISKAILAHFAADTPENRTELAGYFDTGAGFGNITSINALDGIRITFDSGDIAHLRPSGNAPQLRIYSVAGTQDRADEVVALALGEPDGIFRRMQKTIER